MRSINVIPTYQNNKRYKSITKQLTIIKQNANDYIENYLTQSNIPTNDHKCYAIPFQDCYQKLNQVIQE